MPDAPSGNAHAAYYAHYANIHQYFPDADLSRVDSMIAVRHRAMGHSPQDVAESLYECALTIRQNPEDRDWQRYAERTVDYALCKVMDALNVRLQVVANAP